MPFSHFFSSEPMLYFLESPFFRPDYKCVHVRLLSLHELIYQLKSALTSVGLSAYHDLSAIVIYQHIMIIRLP